MAVKITKKAAPASPAKPAKKEPEKKFGKEGSTVVAEKTSVVKEKAKLAVVMDATKRTAELQRIMASPDDCFPQEINPNEMSDRAFNLLVDNIQRVGFTDPVLVKPHPTMKGKWRIVGGEHRWRAGKLLEMKQIPLTVVSAKDFDEDAEKFQIVRHNIIHGRMSPDKFVALYQSLSQKYSEEVAAEAFGFADEEEFKKLVKSTEASLPPEMKEQFKAAAAEIKTLDDLAKILNHMFTTFGDTLTYGYMIFDYGGKDSVWIRMSPVLRKEFDKISHRCREEGKTLEDIIGGLFTAANSKEWAAHVTSIFDKAEKVKFKVDAKSPSLDFLDEHLK